jgi:hypothetical protein
LAETPRFGFDGRIVGLFVAAVNKEISRKGAKRYRISRRLSLHLCALREKYSPSVTAIRVFVRVFLRETSTANEFAGKMSCSKKRGR